MSNSSFNTLIKSIEQAHSHLQQSAVKALNQALTMRNWFVGYYIVEFEQNGDDRAKYGKYLLKSLAGNLDSIKGMDERSLRRYRLFYLYYPQLSEPIQGLLTPESHLTPIRGLLTPELETNAKGDSISQKNSDLCVPGEKIISKLSYTHIEQLLSINDPLKRTFYEIESIKSTWSVKELKRQIRTLLFERSGFADKPEVVLEKVNQKLEPQKADALVKDVYSFEFAT